jgi:hypothetical protein
MLVYVDHAGAGKFRFYAAWFDESEVDIPVGADLLGNSFSKALEGEFTSGSLCFWSSEGF